MRPKRAGGKSLQPECAASEVATFAGRYRSRYGHPPRGGYLPFLALTDGVRHDGVQAYGSRVRGAVGNSAARTDSLFNANRQMRVGRGEDFESMVVFGHGEMDLWVYDIPAGRLKVHNHGGDDAESHQPFESLMTPALRGRLSRL